MYQIYRLKLNEITYTPTEIIIICKHRLSPTCGLVVEDLGFPIGNQVQFPLVPYWGGYWAIMVTNPPRGVRS
ncbi:hypothetical protein Hanom_Chr12g01115101 [Helianthus anomalus]